MIRHTPVRLALAAGLSLAAAGCSLLRTRPPARPVPKAVRVVPTPAPLPLPVQTERFVLHPGQTVIGRVQVVRVAKGQTLSDIARLFNVGYDAIVHANPKVPPWVPEVGTPVIVPTQFVLPDSPHVGIVVDIAAFRMFYFPPHKRGQPQIVITHPVGIGRIGWHTPTGVTHVVWHEKNPVWHVPPSIMAEHRKEGAPLPPVVGPGPDNPLGDYALHLGWPGYLIHGTNEPVSVGRRVSHGCIHLYPEDIAQIFRMAPNGTPVRVVNQPYLFGWKDGRLYLQSYGALKDDKRPWNTRARLIARMLPRALRRKLALHHQKVDWQRVRSLVKVPRVVPMPVSGQGPETGALVFTLVQNRLPAGSTWTGKTGLPMTDTQFDKEFAGIVSPVQGKARAASGAASTRSGSVSSREAPEARSGDPGNRTHHTR